MKHLLLSLLLVGPSAFLTALAQSALPANMFADSAHAPFLWGVASGDPLPDGVVLWTRADPNATQGIGQSLLWQVATDEAMTTVVQSGNVTASATGDHCVRVEVSGLNAATTYYYRFQAENGTHSVVGRTRTAPAGATPSLKFVVASCSSLFSGFFNAYKRIAERDDLDLVIHLGDYIYDFVDPDEEVRVPQPYPLDPETEDEWRERHLLYLLDPDLRAARQMHPWVVVWDNHDFSRSTLLGIPSFWEYVPRRDVHNDVTKTYRNYSFGDLVDLTMIDIQQYRGQDTIAPGEASTLSHEQRTWYLDQLAGSMAKWRITGNQKMFGGWYSEGIPSWIPVPNDGGVFTRGSWDGYQAERDTILKFIEDNSINNFVVLSGDAHMSFGMDVSRAPRNGSVYDPATGNGSLGVEFLPTSITRGNFDESGVPAFAMPVFESASNGINPHHRYVDFIRHGYGILNIDHDSIVAEWWYAPILEQSSSEVLTKSLTVEDGHNRWRRGGHVPNDVADPIRPERAFELFPNPNQGQMNVRVLDSRIGPCNVRVMDMHGKVAKQFSQQRSSQFVIDMVELKSGTYILELTSGDTVFRNSFVLQTR